MTSGELQSVEGEQHPCPICGAPRNWQPELCESHSAQCDTCGTREPWKGPDEYERRLVEDTGLCSYVQLKSKVEAVRKGVFNGCKDRWNAYWTPNLATLHDIGAARHFLDGIRKLTVEDTVLLRFYVPAFFAGLTASLDCLALEIHLLVCLEDPSLDSTRSVGFSKRLKDKYWVLELKPKLKCAAQSGDCSEADSIRQLRKCVLCSEDAKKLRDKAFEWRNAYAHRPVVFSGYTAEGPYLFGPNFQPWYLEKWVPPISECTRQYLLEKHGQRMLPSLEEHWQSARRIIDKSWSLMADIVDVRMKG